MGLFVREGIFRVCLLFGVCSDRYFRRNSIIQNLYNVSVESAALS